MLLDSFLWYFSISITSFCGLPPLSCCLACILQTRSTVLHFAFTIICTMFSIVTVCNQQIKVFLLNYYHKQYKKYKKYKKIQKRGSVSASMLVPSGSAEGWHVYSHKTNWIAGKYDSVAILKINVLKITLYKWRLGANISRRVISYNNFYFEDICTTYASLDRAFNGLSNGILYGDILKLLYESIIWKYNFD